MTDEEAIDILANCIDDYVIGDFCAEGYCPMEKECEDKECPFNEAIETVLNLIQKQQSEIEREKKYYEFVRDLVDKYHDLTHKFLEADINIIKKKDKIIDLMAERLVEAHEWFYSEFDNYSKEEFIEYFKRKVEDK